jgi:hypothetical protein
MSQIGPGDRVECVWTSEQDHRLVVGQSYTVESVVLYQRAKPCACHGKVLGGLKLREAPLHPWASWCIGCFRKRPPARSAMFERMLEVPEHLPLEHAHQFHMRRPQELIEGQNPLELEPSID